MLFAKTIISLLSLVAGQAFARPASPSSEGMISKNTNTVGDYYITKLNTYNSTANGTAKNHISFNVHGADDVQTPSFCTYEWPTNGSYYVETYVSTYHKTEIELMLTTITDALQWFIPVLDQQRSLLQPYHIPARGGARRIFDC